MTELLYPRDSYLKDFEAVVIGAEDGLVELDRTVFYPHGGGQPSDEGPLQVGDEVYLVREVFRQDGRVLRCLDRCGPAAGARARGRLDWKRRYALMRHHTGCAGSSASSSAGW